MKKLNKHALVACAYVYECLWRGPSTAHAEPEWVKLAVGLQTYYPNENRAKQLSYQDDYVNPYLKELESNIRSTGETK